MSTDGTYIAEPLQGGYRYIKVLLINAKNIPKDEALAAKYMVTYNEENTKSYYSHTAIAEISVFASGLAPAEDLSNAGTNNGNNDIVLTIAIVGGALVLGVALGFVVGKIITKKDNNASM